MTEIITSKNLPKPKIGFGAIKVMREIRDNTSIEIMDMTYEEERIYLDKIIAEGKANKK